MHDNQHSSRRSESGDSSRPRRNRSGGGRRDSHSHHRGGRDSSRGGRDSSSRSNYSSGSGDRRSGSGPSTPPRPQVPAKTGFWQKLVSLFIGKPKSSSRSSSSSRSLGGTARPATGSSESRPPASNGHRRFENDAAPSRQARKPELVEVNSPKIYVGNLSFDATEGDLFELFNGVGKVQNAEIVSNKYTQKSKGFAFVTMLTVDEARRAVTELHDKDFMGRKLVVSGAKTTDVTRDGGSRSQEDRPESAPQAAASHEESTPEDIAPAS